MSTAKFAGLRALLVVVMAHLIGFLGGAISTTKLFMENPQWGTGVWLATVIASVILGVLTYRATILDVEAEIQEWQRSVD